MADPEPPVIVTAKDGSASSIGDLGTKFDVMIDLMKSHIAIVTEQSKTQTEQSQILRDHSKMLEALEKDATRDDKAYEERGLKDKSTWGALDKEALAKMKVIVDGWKDLMNVSLIFIALFLTVICNSVMCVLGLQWAGRLLSVPPGKTNLERALNRERRKVLAEQRLLPLMGVLFWTLLLSIAFFVIGFLIQFWALSFSFDERAPILVIGAVAATALAITILGVILATTYHATVYKNSPFESPLSTAARASWAWVKQVTKKHDKERRKMKDKQKRWHPHQFTIAHLKSLLHCIRRFAQWVLRKRSLATELSSHESSEKERVPEETKKELEEEKPIELMMKESEDDRENVQALKAYARLIINTNDAEVLERAVPSFEIGEWYNARDTLWEVFLAVRERFLATDTSFRVKETVNKQLVYFMQWSGWRDRWMWRDDLEGNAITRWCRDQCKHLSLGSHRQFFSAYVFFASLEPHNEDLRGVPWRDSYEEDVARVLASFERHWKLGDREYLFYSAVIECRSLLYHGRLDDVTRILSRGDRTSILRSLLRNPHRGWIEIEGIVALITRGNEVAVLGDLAKFFSNLPDIYPVASELLVLNFLGSLIPSLPWTFTLPRSFDLTPTLILLLRYQSRIGYSLLRYTNTLIYFLDHGGFEVLSSLRPAYDFFQSLLTLSSDDDSQRRAERNRARIYLGHEAFVALSPPSAQDLQNLLKDLQSYQNNIDAEDREECFIDAVKQCDSLSREGRQDEIKLILSQVDRVPLLGLILRNPHFSVVEGNELDHSRLAPALIATIPSIARSDIDLPIIAFLASLIPSLPLEDIVPPEFDLSQTLKLFMANGPTPRTWRKHSDTLMHYLHRGAFEALSNQKLVRRFLNLCRKPSDWWMNDWSQDQRTSTLTRERAIERKKKLHVLNAARRQACHPVITTPAVIINEPSDPSTTGEEVQPRLPTPRTWDAFAISHDGWETSGEGCGEFGQQLQLGMWRWL
ncbi:hypothetical protein SISNIDRAFT_486993 [Sistotremastrum niveocremeum HHB9708]|uniref:DUF6535 domain-containing protein n=1 Tax=Sistotremastrum niveocremeum HHB9708 TaxID=1314777 RepID=A0A164T435_9AGAM|nr:hypothetical protein SISNIDRAFT_486993 [Sistotremastrum niveocremeum HHB9708]